MLCVPFSILYSQSNKDLNSPERVQALYTISMEYIQLSKDVKKCKETYNKEMAEHEARFKQIQSLSNALGEESSAFASHNLDLQEGLLSTMDKVEKLEVKNAKLESKVKRRFAIGLYGGYDPIIQKPSVGLSLNYNLLYLF
jgi:hypothetical protein